MGTSSVVKQCCAGLPEKTTSVEFDQVDPTSGATLHTVAIGFTDADHTSLSVDSTGAWLLYLWGDNLEVSHGRGQASANWRQDLWPLRSERPRLQHEQATRLALEIGLVRRYLARSMLLS